MERSFVNPIGKITSFKDLMNEIGYSWDYPSYELEKTEDGNFVLNKLFITPTSVTYKLEYWDLSPGVFEQVEFFYNFLNETSL